MIFDRYTNTEYVDYYDHGFDMSLEEGFPGFDNWKLYHICYYDDNHYVRDYEYRFAKDMTFEMIARSMWDLTHTELSKPVKFTELWIDAEGEEPIVEYKRETTLSLEFIRDFGTDYDGGYYRYEGEHGPYLQVCLCNDMKHECLPVDAVDDRFDDEEDMTLLNRQLDLLSDYMFYAETIDENEDLTTTFTYIWYDLSGGKKTELMRREVTYPNEWMREKVNLGTRFYYY